jgi:hypothetical protein
MGRRPLGFDRPNSVCRKKKKGKKNRAESSEYLKYGTVNEKREKKKRAPEPGR